MINDEFDNWFDTERREFMEIEDTTPVIIPEEEIEETEKEVCTCSVSIELCLLHNEPIDE